MTSSYQPVPSSQEVSHWEREAASWNQASAQLPSMAFGSNSRTSPSRHQKPPDSGFAGFLVEVLEGAQDDAAGQGVVLEFDEAGHHCVHGRGVGEVG